MQIYNREEIIEATNWKKNIKEIVELQKQAFIEYAQRKITNPLPLQMKFKDHIGDCHVKAGYRNNSKYFFIKTVCGFYENQKKGLPTNHGIILIFSQETGGIRAFLHDEGYLTQIRTAIAGCILPYYLGLSNFEKIGIIGTGTQASWEIEIINALEPSQKFLLWGRNEENAQKLKNKFPDIDIEVVKDIKDLIEKSNCIITTTPSHTPLIFGSDVLSPKLIIGIGADEKGKHEVDSSVFKKADYLIVDSIKQTTKLGDISYAIENGSVLESNIIELGEALLNIADYKNKINSIMTLDLTGIIAQDIFIDEWVYKKLLKQKS